MHRRIRHLLLLAVLPNIACSDFPSAPPATPIGTGSLTAARVIERVSAKVPFSEVSSSACLGEETLTISGTFYEQLITMALPGEPVHHYELTDVYRGTAIGSSGTTYKYVNTQHQTLSQPNLESTHWTFSFPTQILMIGAGAAPNLIVHFTTHTTVLPSGELKVSMDEIRVTCQNRWRRGLEMTHIVTPSQGRRAFGNPDPSTQADAADDVQIG